MDLNHCLVRDVEDGDPATAHRLEPIRYTYWSWPMSRIRRTRTDEPRPALPRRPGHCSDYLSGTGFVCRYQHRRRCNLVWRNPDEKLLLHNGGKNTSTRCRGRWPRPGQSSRWCRTHEGHE